MNPFAIIYSQKRSRLSSKIMKTFISLFSSPVEATPVFVLGIQRSGTTMLMHAFHLHKCIEVFDESKKNKAFFAFRLRSMSTTLDLIKNSRFQIICFKPLADSHLAGDLLNISANTKVIWALRDYKDVANSFIRKFPHATRAIRIACKGEEGGGWFQEGISTDINMTLQNLPWKQFSEYDFACLVWWTRNKLFFEQNLHQDKNVIILRYEELVQKPFEILNNITNFLQIPFFPKMATYIHARSIAKHPHPKISPHVQELCEELSDSFHKIIKVS